ncbi:MAG TPA: hemolysin family protein [bacterium]|nr:hemolysin family protein [bacterium]
MFSLSLVFIMLLGLSAFFSGSETALFSLSGVELHKFRLSRAGYAKKIFENLRYPRKILITILLGNELVNAAISIVGAAMVSMMLPLGVKGQTIAAVAIITPIILVFGEIIPKNVALGLAPQVAPVVIWPLHLFQTAVRPLRHAFTWVADRFVLFFGGSPEKSEPMIMEQEFRRMVDLGSKEGAIVEEEREIIHNVFDFTDKVVSDIMTPADRLYSLPVDMPYEQVIESIRGERFSRVPVHEGEPGRVVGILHVGDLFSLHRMRMAGRSAEVRDVLHEPLFIAPETPLESLMREFQRTQLHMAVVKNADGSMAGVVTMDDVLEELFGEMES